MDYYFYYAVFTVIFIKILFIINYNYIFIVLYQYTVFIVVRASSGIYKISDAMLQINYCFINCKRMFNQIEIYDYYVLCTNVM